MATATNAPRPRRNPRGGETARAWGGVGNKFGELLERPQINYMVILSITLILTGFGITMVLSSSMVTSRAMGASVWTEFLKQLVMVLAGLFGLWASLRARVETIRRISGPLLLLAVFLLLLLFVPGLGVGGEEVGNNSWIRLGPVGIQPSEVAKLALAIWGSANVSLRARQTRKAIPALSTFLSVGGCLMLLVLLQKDLGMMLTVGIVLMAILFFAGVSSIVFTVTMGVVAVVGAGAILAQSFRSNRLHTWVEAFTLNFDKAGVKGTAYQSYQGILSLSDGGLTGAGLGQSRAKWFYLPEAKNDFIFAIVGEELGWIGAIAIVLLFALLGWFGIRTALAQTDPFLRMLAATLTVGVVVQAFYNMGYVMGFMPVTGIQLPLISAGGTSAVITLVSLGLLANCARHEPAAVSSMQHEGLPWIDRVLLLPEPRSRRSGDRRRVERRSTSQRYGDPVTRRAPTAGSRGHDVRRVPGRSSLEDYDSQRRTRIPDPDSRQRRR